MPGRTEQIAKIRAEVFPLEDFPEAKRAEIARLVAQDWPPPKWLRFGPVQMVSRAWYGDVEPGDVHLDHIKPWSKGGHHSVDNLQVTHSTCNLRKGAKL